MILKTATKHRHGDKQHGVDSNGLKVTHVYFKPTIHDKGCWLHENVFSECCFRRGIKQ